MDDLKDEAKLVSNPRIKLDSVLGYTAYGVAVGPVEVYYAALTGRTPLKIIERDGDKTTTTEAIDIRTHTDRELRSVGPDCLDGVIQMAEQDGQKQYAAELRGLRRMWVGAIAGRP